MQEKYLFIEYPKCSTCQKAKKWLDDHHVSYKDRHIVEDNPTKEELRSWIRQSGYPIKKFFNTSGNMYKEQHLSTKLPSLTEEEQLDLLASHGMLVKRPLLIGKDKTLVGFKEEEWKTTMM